MQNCRQESDFYLTLDPWIKLIPLDKSRAWSCHPYTHANISTIVLSPCQYLIQCWLDNCETTAWWHKDWSKHAGFALVQTMSGSINTMLVSKSMLIHQLLITSQCKSTCRVLIGIRNSFVVLQYIRHAINIENQGRLVNSSTLSDTGNISVSVSSNIGNGHATL